MIEYSNSNPTIAVGLLGPWPEPYGPGRSMGQWAGPIHLGLACNASSPL